jgi:hypothetical protein
MKRFGPATGLLLSLALAGCPIPPDNYGDAGATDAGSVADAGPVVTVDAGSSTGALTCAIAAEDDLGNTSTSGGAWAGADLSNSVVTTSDGTNYTVTLEGSSSSSGTLELQISPLAVGTTGALPTSSLVLEGFTPGSTLGVQDTWTCGVGGACSPYVDISSFTGTNITGTFTVQFYQGSSSSLSTTCSLTSGTFNITFP